jgi:hypothetical protein
MTNIIQKSTTTSKCSCKGCNNQATSYILTRQKVYLCDECFEKLASQAIANRTPKSPQNTIKRKLDQKREENYE